MSTNLIGTKVHTATDDSRAPMSGTITYVFPGSGDELVVVAWDTSDGALAPVLANEWLDELVRS